MAVGTRRLTWELVNSVSTSMDSPSRGAPRPERPAPSSLPATALIAWVQVQAG